MGSGQVTLLQLHTSIKGHEKVHMDAQHLGKLEKKRAELKCHSV